MPAAVLEGVRRREPEALGTYFEAHVDRVYGLADRLLGNRAAAEAPALAAALRPGGEIATPPDGDLTLRAARTMLLHVTPDTRARLPGAPGRWFGRTEEGAMLLGEVRGPAGPAFRGGPWRLRTAEAMIAVSGSTFGVIRRPDMTCVCVYEGKVSIGRAESGMAPIPAGTRRFSYGSGQCSGPEALPPDEVMNLGALPETARAAFR